MPRKKLERKKNEYIMFAIEPDKKAALEAWCAANSTTMSEVIRTEIAHYIESGEKLLQSQG
jgi:hypothetical protein